MAVTENLSCWECDRCGGQGERYADEKIYMDPGDEDRLGWERVTWALDDGTTREAVLGPLCAAEWHDRRKAMDSEVRAFMNAYGDKKEG